MKLSEAIMLGSTMSPQAFGVARRSDGAACALAAAGDANGVEYGLDLFQVWPFLLTKAVDPVTTNVGPAWSIIVDLNDCQMWSRERIADWVASVEPHEEQTEEVQKSEKVVSV